jgi:hypothetical protein
MTTDRESPAASLLSDGRVLITGGSGPRGPNAQINSAEIYDPKTGMFSLTGSMTVNTTEVSATLLTDGRVLITCGSGPIAELYTP